VYYEKSEDLSVNLIEKHPIPPGFSLERSGNNPVLLSQLVALDSPFDLMVAEYLFTQRRTLPFINGRGNCQTHRILWLH
jgi:hypothetical protein